MSRPLFFLALLILPGLCRLVVATDPPAERELHVVCIQSGSFRTGLEIHGERATVSVERPGKNVVLFLGSQYHGVRWEVVAGRDTTLQKVILGGYRKQAVKGLPEGVEVLERFGDEDDAFIGHNRLEAPHNRRLISQLWELTKLPVSSFTGVEIYNSAIRVDQVQDDPRLDLDYPHVRNDVGIANVRFPAVYWVPRPDGHDSTMSVGEFTLRGPDLKTMRQLPQNYTSLVFDPLEQEWYGLRDFAFALDRDLTKATKLTVDGKGAFDFGLRPMALDTKRRRLVVTTLGPEWLYSYSIAERKWSIGVGLGRTGIDVLCYHAHEDAFYGLGFDSRDGFYVPILVRLNAHGAVTSRRDLHVPTLYGLWGHMTHHRYGGPMQLISAGEHLVIIRQPESRSDADRLNPTSYVVLVDPQTATGVLTGKYRSGVPTDAADAIKQGVAREGKAEAGRSNAAPKASAPNATKRTIDRKGLPDLRFDAPYFVSGQYGHSSVSWGKFTLAGPDLESLRSLPEDVCYLGYDAAKQVLYGSGRHGVSKMSLADQTLTKLDLGLDVPALGWPSGSTFDSKRRRFLVLSTGFIYQCDVDQDHHWTVLAEIDRNVGATFGLTYEPKADALYVVSRLDSEPFPRLVQLNSEGKLKRSIPLPASLLEIFVSNNRENLSQMLSVEGQLVILYYPTVRENQPAVISPAMYLVDPATGRARLTWVQ